MQLSSYPPSHPINLSKSGSPRDWPLYNAAPLLDAAELRAESALLCNAPAWAVQCLGPQLLQQCCPAGSRGISSHAVYVHPSPLLHLSCNCYRPPFAQLQRQREIGTVGSGAMELDWPWAPARGACSASQQGLATQISLSPAWWGPELPEQLSAQRLLRTDASNSTVSHITRHGHRDHA